VLLLLLVAIGAAGVLGFFGASFSSITGAITAGAAVAGAWGTFIALLLTPAEALLGGWFGYSRQPGRVMTR
jgi:hypothetical protein